MSYDRDVPNKTIYVADADLPVFERAQELTGDNLSATIVRALRRLVDIEEGRTEGFEEITVRVGTGAGRRQRFVGVLLVEWSRSTSEREETYRVYRSRSGKYVLHLKRSSESVWTAGPDGQATGTLLERDAPALRFTSRRSLQPFEKGVAGRIRVTSARAPLFDPMRTERKPAATLSAGQGTAPG